MHWRFKVKIYVEVMISDSPSVSLCVYLCILGIPDFFVSSTLSIQVYVYPAIENIVASTVQIMYASLKENTYKCLIVAFSLQKIFDYFLQDS